MTEEQTTERDEPQQEEERQDEEGHDEERQDEEGQNDPQAGDGDEGKSDKQKLDEEYEQAKQEVKDLEDDPPQALDEWPSGKAKYETFGGPEGGHGYHEGPEENLGPSSLRHHEDGSVSIEGDEVDDPDEHKGEPIQGGPTDPDTPNLQSDKAEPEDSSRNEGDSSGDDSGEGEDDSGSEGQSESESEDES